MKLGLIGAIGGLGKAAETIGSSIVARREKALEEARQMAQYERQRADKTADKEADREFMLERDDALQTRQDARQSASLTQQERLAGKAQDFRTQERKASQAFTSSEREAARAGARELTKLSSQLSRDNSAASARLTKELSASDTAGVQYGAPNEQGYAEVIRITKNGQVVPTGKRVYRPAKSTPDDDEPLS